LLSRLPGAVALAHRLARLTPRVPDLRRWLAGTDEMYDLVVAANICYETFLAAGAEFATRRGLPLILHPFTHLGAGSKPGSDAISQFDTMRHQVALVRAASASVMMTPAERDYYVNQGVASERLPVVGSGVEPADVLGGDGTRARAALATDEPIVLMLGSLSPDKGATQTIDAVRQLWAAGRSVQLVLAGARTAALDAFLASLPAAVRARLVLLGRVDDQTRRDLLAACDMLVMPSRADSFGIAFLEAWLYGKPVIGADAWGIRDGIIRHGVDGFLVPFADAPALAAAITTLLNEPQIATALGNHGREKVLREHTWAQKLQTLEALYRTVSQCR
jgi:glycosyltransferase involved in cell wall biosynthesis